MHGSPFAFPPSASADAKLVARHLENLALIGKASTGDGGRYSRLLRVP